MAPQVLSHAGLTDAQIRSVERQQFLPLDPKRKDWYENQRKYYEALFLAERLLQESQSLDSFVNAQGDGTAGVTKRAGSLSSLRDLAINKNGYRLTARAFATVINARNKHLMREANEESMTDTYMQMICHYTSWVRAGFRFPVRKPSCAMLASGDLTALKRSLMRPSENPIETAHSILKNAGVAGDAFLALDFLFIPWVDNDAGHVVLAGLAPTQRFAFVIDSIPGTYRASTGICVALKNLILSQTRASEFVGYAADNQNARQAEWRLYGQWSHRATGTLDDSPDGAQQQDAYNCGVFAATTAFCLAFGHRLTCFKEADLDAHKKPRMAAEFANGGFSGDGFEYDLFDLKYIVGRSAQQATAAAPQDRKPSLLKRVFTRQPDEQGGLGLDAEHESGSDSGEERRTSMEWTYESDPGSSGSDGESDDEGQLPFRKEPLYTASQLAAIRNPTPARAEPAQPEPDATPFPYQFSARRHMQAVLVYGAPAGWNVQKRRYSKRELKRVCRDFGLAGWKGYSWARQEVFARWVASEAAAVLARRLGGGVGPAPGTGEASGLEGGKEGGGRSGWKRRKADESPRRLHPKRSVKRKRGA